jgi:starch phosphorylase
MKAALNGVPNFSILDGWWIEGHIEGVTGWAIGAESPDTSYGQGDWDDALSLYDKLEKVIIPLYYQNRAQFINIMLSSIAINGSYFNTHRMVQEYVLNAYFSGRQ